MPCPHCHKGETDTFCENCIREITAAVMGAEQDIRAKAVCCVKMGESNYLRKTIAYSDEASERQNANNGSAVGFTAKGKIFELQKDFNPTEAIYSFINPSHGQTVCECKTFMCAVFYRATCEKLNEIHQGHFDSGRRSQPNRPGLKYSLGHVD